MPIAFYEKKILTTCSETNQKREYRSYNILKYWVLASLCSLELSVFTLSHIHFDQCSAALGSQQLQVEILRWILTFNVKLNKEKSDFLWNPWEVNFWWYIMCALCTYLCISEKHNCVLCISSTHRSLLNLRECRIAGRRCRKFQRCSVSSAQAVTSAPYKNIRVTTTLNPCNEMVSLHQF